MFHFLKDFLCAKWQVNREHIHNKINMQSIKSIIFQEYYNSREACFSAVKQMCPIDVLLHSAPHLSEHRITDG